MAEKINWTDFESQYFSPEKGEQYRLVLANWRQETRSYDDGKTEKPVIVFDVLKIGTEEYTIGRKQFATTAASFAEEVRPIIEKAEKKGKQAIHVVVKYSDKQRYSVVNLEE